jgi:large subunit ribosomal protein L17
VTQLFRHEQIRTTEAKAKAIRPQAERLITLAKRGDLHARRLAARDVQDPETLRKLFDELAERYEDREGGYTRIYRLGLRKGDAAPVVLISLVE